MEESILNKKIQKVQGMRNPVVVMNEIDFDKLKDEVKKNTNIKIDESNPSVFGLPIKVSPHQPLGIFSVIDYTIPTTPPPPEYVKLSQTALRLNGNVYFRDAGDWSIKFKHVEGGFLSDCPEIPHINNLPLIPITKEEWVRDNK